MMEVKKSGGSVAAVVAFVMITFMFSGTTLAGNLEPSAPPGPTMKTLDEIPPTWSQILPASTRFVLVMGGAAVLDKETGLVWEQSPSIDTVSWLNAHFHCTAIVTKGNRRGWRLPTIQELTSLVDTTQLNPTLPAGHPFSNVQLTVGNDFYWSATTYAGNSTLAWFTIFSEVGMGYIDKTRADFHVWCVRGGQGVDPQ